MNTAPNSQRDLIEKVNLFQSLNFRLLIFSLAIGLIPLILMMTITIFQNRTAFQKNAETNLLVTAKAQGQLLSNWFQSQLDFVSYVAQLPELQSMEPDAYIPVIAQAQKGMQFFDLFYLIGPDGMQIYKTDDSTLVDLSERDYFTRAMQGEALIGSPVVSKATGKLLIPVVAPVKDQNGRIVAVLAGSLSLDTVSTLFKEMQFGNTGEAILLNEEGYFLTGSRFSEQLLQTGKIKERAELEMQSQSDELKKAIAGEANVVAYISYMGSEAIGAFAPVQAANIKWAIVVKQDTNEVFKNLNVLTNWLIIILIVITAVIIIFATLYVRSLIRSLHIIVQAGVLLSIGDSSLTGMRMEDRKNMRERKDEIGSIARSFTKMIQYQKDVAQAAQKIAEGDLTVEMNVKSENDLIGNSLKEMIKNLRSLIRNVQQSVEIVNNAANQLSSASEQAGQATGQITLTMQQVASGTSDQSQATGQSTLR